MSTLYNVLQSVSYTISVISRLYSLIINYWYSFGYHTVIHIHNVHLKFQFLIDLIHTMIINDRKYLCSVFVYIHHICACIWLDSSMIFQNKLETWKIKHSIYIITSIRVSITKCPPYGWNANNDMIGDDNQHK